VPSPAEVAVGLLRWLEYAGLIYAIGVLVVRRLASNQPSISWARPPMRPALAAAFVGGLGVVGVEAFGESFGWVHVVRVIAEGAALALCLLSRRFVAPLAIFAAAALAFAGHAAVAGVGAMFGDALHVLSAGIWAGGIMALATLRPRGGWSGEGRALLARFGRVAVIAFAITAMTGVLNATAQVGDISNLTTGYGLVLSAKSLAVLAMVALSALAWRRGFGALRLEAALAIVVIGATALLAAYPVTPAGVEINHIDNAGPR
jgi:putative copper export protein